MTLGKGEYIHIINLERLVPCRKTNSKVGELGLGFTMVRSSYVPLFISASLKLVFITAHYIDKKIMVLQLRKRRNT